MFQVCVLYFRSRTLVYLVHRVGSMYILRGIFRSMVVRL